MTKAWHGGKGSSPRKGANNEKYASNWDAIFSKKEKPEFDEEKTLGNVHENGFDINNKVKNQSAE